MNFVHKSLLPAIFGLSLAPLTSAIAEDLHHPPDATTEAPAAPSEQPAVAPAMPMMNMMGQQSQGMPMMNMMGQGGMGMMGQGAMPMAGGMAGPNMPMADMGAHLEGRIAFLRAELGITETQATQWDAFAQALRDGAAKLKHAQAIPMQPATGSIDFLQRVTLQEQWLGARLEGIRAVKLAFTELQAVLSDDQKKIAEELLTQPVCFGQMGMM
jgi:hypothetical protein